MLPLLAVPAVVAGFNWVAGAAAGLLGVGCYAAGKAAKSKEMEKAMDSLLAGNKSATILLKKRDKRTFEFRKLF